MLSLDVRSMNLTSVVGDGIWTTSTCLRHERWLWKKPQKSRCKPNKAIEEMVENAENSHVRP